jgi:transcriptional regulator with XRE-family HTH domain
MGFKENLKAELAYKDILVKELAASAGISQHTLNNYLSTRGQIPSADVAVKIARVLGVSVEYLITGCESAEYEPAGEIRFLAMHPEARSFLRMIERLDGCDQKVVFKTALCLAEALHSHKGNVPE